MPYPMPARRGSVPDPLRAGRRVARGSSQGAERLSGSAGLSGWRWRTSRAPNSADNRNNLDPAHQRLPLHFGPATVYRQPRSRAAQGDPDPPRVFRALLRKLRNGFLQEPEPPKTKRPPQPGGSPYVDPKQLTFPDFHKNLRSSECGYAIRGG
jgi:hypothetical protein